MTIQQTKLEAALLALAKVRDQLAVIHARANAGRRRDTAGRTLDALHALTLAEVLIRDTMPELKP